MFGTNIIKLMKDLNNSYSKEKLENIHTIIKIMKFMHIHSEKQINKVLKALQQIGEKINGNGLRRSKR